MSCRPSLAATTSQHTRAYASKKTKHTQQRHRNNDDKDNTNPTEQRQSQPEDGSHATFSSKRAPITTMSLKPGSQQVVTDPAAQDELMRAAAKMVASVEWFRREVAQLEARAIGRITPQLLSPVRVVLPDGSSPRWGKGEDARGVRLEELATVGVRDGSSLNLKHVQDALYEAKIQGVIPQRVDERTLRIPMPKPTVEARLAAYSTASKQAEDARVQIRRQYQASVRKRKCAKRSIEHDEFQRLQDRYITEVDTALAQIRKNTGAR
ncbi:ribosome recycling factor [Lactifluus volemus]|nr:ribosome recycling factor [Lactifluus volemus]